MASISQLMARLVDLFGPGASADPTKLLGNLEIAPSGNVLVGTATDNGVQKLQVAGNAKVTGYVARQTPIAFSLTQYYYNISNFATNQVVVMGSSTWGGTVMQTNVGSCFNTTTGTFTAPVAGLYVFTAGLTTANGDTYVQLVVNGTGLGYSVLEYTTGNGFGSQSNTWVVTLAAGATVQCQMATNNSTTALGFGNSFCGYLV